MRGLLRIMGVFLLGGSLLAGCGRGDIQSTSATLQVTVSILPQRYFVERIGGEHVDVNVMVLPGESPATYEPRPAQLRALSEADAYVSIGVPFEDAWLERIASANGEMMMVDTTQGIERMGGPENPDPHIWLSPALVKIQAETICEALVALDAAHADDYRANRDAFVADIDALDAEIRETLADVEQRRFMVFHPSWGYFARDYGLEMMSIEVGGQEPSAAELARLIAKANEEGIEVIFAQPEFSTEAAETIAEEIGGEVLLISPLAEDWLGNMRRVADTFAEQLGA
jgi:zinc transport system substrate-binding protein